MLDRFRSWYLKYQNEITWWIIGWLCFAFLDQLGRGHYIMAFIDAGLAYFNYRMWKDNYV